MWKWIGAIIVVILLIGLAIVIYGYSQMRKVEVTEVTDDLFMISGMGSNVGVLRTDVGAVVVDSMTFEFQGKKIRKLVKEKTGQDVALVINTHYHFDHTHGNPGLGAEGLRIIATEKTRDLLNEFDGKYWQGENKIYMPNETFEEEKSLLVGGKRLRLEHPGPGHTSGDLIVHFIDENAVHMGDLYFNGLFPFIDIPAGGSVQNWGAAIEAALAFDAEHILPGHGPLSSPEEMRNFQAYIDELAAAARATKAKNLSCQRFVEDTELEKTDGIEPISFMHMKGPDAKQNLAWAYEELHGVDSCGEGKE